MACRRAASATHAAAKRAASWCFVPLLAGGKPRKARLIVLLTVVMVCSPVNVRDCTAMPQGRGITVESPDGIGAGHTDGGAADNVRPLPERVGLKVKHQLVAVYFEAA